MSTEEKQTVEQEAAQATYAAGDQQEQAAEAVAGEPQEAAADTELEALRKQADENHQRYLRAQADFDNFRRRSRQEKEEFAKYASLKLIEQLLPVVDNFERALSSSKETKDFDSLVKGLDMTFRQLDQLLSQEGVTAIEAVGQPFNPEFHQAVMQVESEEHEEGIVVEELQKGYVLKDKVIRPAMVKVSV
ncbi:nucleotide exchange factor GrpE [Paenibacillus athensensis]|uniref:Protein GrpE n=1 Tax=Paenibacillus athensensis TaxID=1967502 RepID=A0A4Y8Q417_9BACL|nr:nucleotide exchange factor GrpE [Paenibacillus athensensis]MCD1258489.1 nucleotide exchange factor GrpE [Paenibacillus athensensis]